MNGVKKRRAWIHAPSPLPIILQNGWGLVWSVISFLTGAVRRRAAEVTDGLQRSKLKDQWQTEKQLFFTLVWGLSKSVLSALLPFSRAAAWIRHECCWSYTLYFLSASIWHQIHSIWCRMCAKKEFFRMWLNTQQSYEVWFAELSFWIHLSHFSDRFQGEQWQNVEAEVKKRERLAFNWMLISSLYHNTSFFQPSNLHFHFKWTRGNWGVKDKLKWTLCSED